MLSQEEKVCHAERAADERSQIKITGKCYEREENYDAEADVAHREIRLKPFSAAWSGWMSA